MTARNGSAEWPGSVKTGSGTTAVGDGVFKGGYSYESRFGERERVMTTNDQRVADSPRPRARS
jgi:hypothetical protein